MIGVRETDLGIMEGLLERAGLEMDEADRKDEFLVTGMCTRKPKLGSAPCLTTVGQPPC